MPTVDPEFQNLCPALKPEEREKLREQLERDGQLDDLKLWGDILLDGHNRLELLTEMGVEPRYSQVAVNTRAEAINWIIDNQLGRQNLSPTEAQYLRGKRYEAEKKSLSEAALEREERKRHGGQNDQAGLTSERLASDLSVAEVTLFRRPRRP